MADNSALEFQRRCEAIKTARAGLQDAALGGSKLIYGVDDLLTVAEWIVTGARPKEEGLLSEIVPVCSECGFPTDHIGHTEGCKFGHSHDGDPPE